MKLTRRWIAFTLLLLPSFAQAQPNRRSAVLEGQRVVFSRGGTHLVGWFHISQTLGDRHSIILLLHQAQSNHHEWDFLIPDLLKIGSVLALDLRGHGESTPHEDSDRFFERLFTDPDFGPSDVETVLKWIRNRPDVDPSRVLVVGGSVGANLAYVSSGKNWGVCAAVALSGNYDRAIQLAGGVKGFHPRATFVLAAENDPGRAQSARMMYEKERGLRKLEILGSSEAHGVSILKESKDLRDEVLDWLREFSR